MAKQKTVTVVRKKKWYPIIAPRLSNEAIGETPAYDAKSLVGRAMNVNLMSLTNDPKKQNVNIRFLITSSDENTAVADPIGYYIVPSTLKRLMRRHSDRIDDSILCETADNIKVRVKTFSLARSLIKASIKTHIRKVARDFIAKYAKKNALMDLISDIVSYKIQGELKEILKKIYPLRTLEVRAVEIVKDPNDERTLVELVQQNMGKNVEIAEEQNEAGIDESTKKESKNEEEN